MADTARVGPAHRPGGRALARAGREAAYRELIRRYERPIFALLFRMVRDRELAEDLSQETFIKALNAIESYRPEFKFSSWIFKIANNAAIDHLRRRELDTLSLDGSPHAETPEAMQATALQIGARQESPLDAVEAQGAGRRHRGGHRPAPAGVPLLHPAAPRRGAGLRGDRRDPGPPARHGEDLHPSGPQRAAAGAGPPREE